jgi:phage terminase large subunit GpA-like protein
MKKESRTIESNRVTTIETHTPQPQPGEAKPGSKEFTAGDFEKFDHVCPRCGFEFDDKK